MVCLEVRISECWPKQRLWSNGMKCGRGVFLLPFAVVQALSTVAFWVTTTTFGRGYYIWVETPVGQGLGLGVGFGAADSDLFVYCHDHRLGLIELQDWRATTHAAAVKTLSPPEHCFNFFSEYDLCNRTCRIDGHKQNRNAANMTLASIL
jgi:hypothetical protein